MKIRFREWGSSDWTYIHVQGELDYMALSILGAGLARFHAQQLVNGEWENL